MLAAVERKSLDNLAATLSDGTLAFQLQRLAELPLAAVVIEARYSALYKLEHVQQSNPITTNRELRPLQASSKPRPRRGLPKRRCRDHPQPRFARRGQTRSPNAGSAPSAADRALLAAAACHLPRSSRHSLLVPPRTLLR